MAKSLLGEAMGELHHSDPVNIEKVASLKVPGCIPMRYGFCLMPVHPETRSYLIQHRFIKVPQNKPGKNVFSTWIPDPSLARPRSAICSNKHIM